jgi:aminopeptidase YwaD
MVDERVPACKTWPSPAGPPPPLELARLLVGRDNGAREAAVARYLDACQVPLVRHRFSTPEGSGENFTVDLGTGDEVLVLIAHHDAVPGSPGANDNAAAVAILLTALERLTGRIPQHLRVRLLFTAAEERDYLGARMYVKEMPLSGIIGVLSLELCGIGDVLALWDAPRDTRFSQQIARALEATGRVRDESWHQVGQIPRFGSDHRAFAAAGLPAYGLTMVPASDIEGLRRFILDPAGRSAAAVGPPRPFDTYHTSRDTIDTLEPAALDAVVRALTALVNELG